MLQGGQIPRSPRKRLSAKETPRARCSRPLVGHEDMNRLNDKASPQAQSQGQKQAQSQSQKQGQKQGQKQDMSTPDAPSPCTRSCTIDADRSHCTRCMRTIDEIASWRKMDNEAKWAVLDALTLRREKLPRASR